MNPTHTRAKQNRGKHPYRTVLIPWKHTVPTAYSSYYISAVTKAEEENMSGPGADFADRIAEASQH